MLLDSILGIGNKHQILNFDSGVFYLICENCKECKQSKKFRKRTESKIHSRRPFCLNCEKSIAQSRYTKNKKTTLATIQKYRQNNWKLKMLWQAKATAARKNLDFNLEESDIVIPSHCKYLNIPLTQSLGEGVIWSNTSLDRIDSSLGYIKGNVEVISRKANSIKNMATIDELRVFAKNVLEIYGE